VKITIRKDDEIVALMTGTIQIRPAIDKFGNTVIEYTDNRAILAVVPPGYFVLSSPEPESEK
jgi:hypothetical protein